MVGVGVEGGWAGSSTGIAPVSCGLKPCAYASVMGDAAAMPAAEWCTVQPQEAPGSLQCPSASQSTAHERPCSTGAQEPNVYANGLVSGLLPLIMPCRALSGSGQIVVGVGRAALHTTAL